MKTILSLAAVAAIVGSLGLSAAPALAANVDKVPQCNASGTSLATASIVDELQSFGATVITADSWNGCIRAIYSLDGKTSMVFFDPDTLKVVSGSMPNVQG